MELLVCTKEKIYFTLLLIISLLIYLLLIVSVVGTFYIIIGLIVSIIARGFFQGQIKGNSIRISEKQFPEVYNLTQQLAMNMQIEKAPPVYILQSGGLLNAFAARFLGRNFVVIYSDVFELAYEKGESALAFVLCHELAHIKRKHLAYNWLIWPASIIPFLGLAYSRACEYTCDRFGAHYVPSGAVLGISVLAAGKKLYANINPQECIKQAEDDFGFWTWITELFATHPHLINRLKAVNKT